MAVMTPFFDIVAGVAILAGRSSLLDAKVFQAANTNITLRQLLALGFIGYGGWNLWKVEKAQDKLKESLESEEGWEDYPTITYQVFGIDDLADAENMSYWYEGGDYSEDDLDSAIQEAQTWWDERDDLDEDDGGGIVRVWVEEKSEHYGVGDNEGSVFTLEAESFESEDWSEKFWLVTTQVIFHSQSDPEMWGASALTEEIISKVVSGPQPGMSRVIVQELDTNDWESYAADSLLPSASPSETNLWEVTLQVIIRSNMDVSLWPTDSIMAEVERLTELGEYRVDVKKSGRWDYFGADSFNAAYLQDPASEYGGPTEMILDTCPVCAEFSNDMTPKELWPRWGKDDDMGYMCDDCWDAMESDPNAQWIYTQEAESFATDVFTDKGWCEWCDGTGLEEDEDEATLEGDCRHCGGDGFRAESFSAEDLSARKEAVRLLRKAYWLLDAMDVYSVADGDTSWDKKQRLDYADEVQEFKETCREAYAITSRLYGDEPDQVMLKDGSIDDSELARLIDGIRDDDFDAESFSADEGKPMICKVCGFNYDTDGYADGYSFCPITQTPNENCSPACDWEYGILQFWNDDLCEHCHDLAEKAESFSADDDYGSKEGYNDLMVDLERSIVEDNPPCPTCGGWTKEHHHMKEGGGLEPYFVCYNCREREEYGADSFSAEDRIKYVGWQKPAPTHFGYYLSRFHATEPPYETTLCGVKLSSEKEIFFFDTIAPHVRWCSKCQNSVDKRKTDFQSESFSADFAGMKYELLVDETGNGLEEAEIVATYPTFEEAKNASQKLHSQTWIAETRFVGDTDEVIESTIIYGAESFSAESRDELIDTLIGIRQELAREEGMEDWENESEGPLDSLSSAFIQELIWYMDGDRDTWNADTLPSAEKTWTTYNAEQDSYGECGCGDHDVTDDDYDACETCATIWEFPDCTSGVCGICFKVCEQCNPKEREKHYQTCTLEG